MLGGKKKPRIEREKRREKRNQSSRQEKWQRFARSLSNYSDNLAAESINRNL